jgi:ferrous iron transport protein B
VKADAMPFYLELPPYRMPPAKLVASQVWGAASRFLKRAGTIILAVSILLWALLTFPRVEPPAQLSEAQAAAYVLEHSAAGRIGHALEPAIAPLGFDWKIGIGLVASLAAREVIVSTLAQIYAASSDDETSLREALANDRDAETGAPIYTPATVAALLVFFVFALQCTSTIATLARETNSWRWPAFAFFYLLALAYGASFAAHRIVGALSA